MYLLDANVFITAKNLHYGFDFVPAFWDWLDLAHKNDRVISVEKVGEELKAGQDELATWAAGRPSFFMEPDASVVASLQATTQWASGAGYAQAAVATFLQSGDYYLVAQAHAKRLTVVTHEVAGNSTKRIKIPDACKALGIACVSPYQMLRTERARFVLG